MKLIKGMPTRHWHKAEWLRIAQEKAKGSAEKGPRTKGPTRAENQTELPALTCHNALGHTLATLAL